MSQFGNLRFARAGNSAVTGGYGDGFLLLNTAHASLHHIGSTKTGMLGHSNMEDWNGGLGSMPPRARWSTQSGSFSLDTVVNGASGTTTVTFSTPYSSAPFVSLMNTGAAEVSYVVRINSVTTSGFSSFFSATKAVGSMAERQSTIRWESNGTVAA